MGVEIDHLQQLVRSHIFLKNSFDLKIGSSKEMERPCQILQMPTL
jgi:hypothetical protein